MGLTATTFSFNVSAVLDFPRLHPKHTLPKADITNLTMKWMMVVVRGNLKCCKENVDSRARIETEKNYLPGTTICYKT